MKNRVAGKYVKNKPEPDVEAIDWYARVRMMLEPLFCIECGQQVKCVGRINWTVEHGVRAVGYCSDCNALLVQHEYNFKMTRVNLNQFERLK